MKKMRYRCLAAMLSLCLMSEIACTVVSAQGDTIPVNTEAPEMPLLNKINYMNTAYREDWLYDRNAEYTLRAGQYFKLVESGGLRTTAKDTVYDSFPVELFHDDNDAWWNAKWEWTLDNKETPILNSLIADGQISMQLSARMQYDDHRNKRHGGFLRKKNDHAYVAFRNKAENWDIQYTQTSTKSAGDMNMVRYGANDWNALSSSLKEGDILQVRANHTTCSCGSSKVNNITVAFADLKGPAVPEVVVSVGDDTDRYYNSGTIEFKLVFDENIRLADPNLTLTKDMAEKYGLNLLAYDRQKNTSVTLIAKLTEIGSNYMCFEYTIDENQEMDVIIEGISGNQPFFEETTMYSYTDTGSWEALGGEDMQTTLVCDLAGNRLNDRWNTNITFEAAGAEGIDRKEIYIDTVSPKYETSSLKGSMIDEVTPEVDAENNQWPEGAERNQVFAGVGDWLQLVIDLDEKVTLGNANDAKVELNLKDANGNPVVVKGAEITEVSDTLRSYIKKTRLITEKFTIAEGWSTSEQGRAIRATQVRMPSGTTDLCGNPFETISGVEAVLEVSEIPAQQEYLDVLPPTVSTNQQQDTDGIYWLEHDTTNKNAVSFHVSIADQEDTSIAEEYRAAHTSGSNAVGDIAAASESGIFVLSGEDGYIGEAVEFEFYVSATPSVPEGAEWKTGIAGQECKFTQVETGNYIFIRYKEGDTGIPIKYPELTVKGFDHAGNKTEQDYRIEARELFNDDAAPVGEATIVPYTDSTDYGLAGDAVITDRGGLAKILYKLDVVEAKENGSRPEYTYPTETDETWTEVTDILGGEKMVFTYSGKLKSKPLDARKNYYGFLSVYAEDVFGNGAIFTSEGAVNWSIASYTIDVPTELGNTTVSVSRLKKTEATERTRTITDSTDTYTTNTYGSLYVYMQPSGSNTAGAPIAAVLDDLVKDESGSLISRAGIIKDTYGAFAEKTTDLLGSMVHPADMIRPWNGTGAGLYFDGVLADSQGGKIANFDENGAITEIFVTDNYSDNYADVVNAAMEKYNPETYYGPVDLYVLNAPASNFKIENGTDNKIYKITSGAEQSGQGWDIQKYKLKFAGNDGGGNINTAEAGTPFMSDGTQLVEVNGAYVREDGIPLNTLAEARLPFTVTNARFAEYGIEDINFEKSHVTFYINGEVYDKTFPLISGSTKQVFDFPDDVAYNCTDSYTVKVTLTAKVSGREDIVDITVPIRFCTATLVKRQNELSVCDDKGKVYFDIQPDNLDSITVHEEMLIIGDSYTDTNIINIVSVCEQISDTGNTCYYDHIDNDHLYTWNAAAPDKENKYRNSIDTDFNVSLFGVKSADDIPHYPEDNNSDTRASAYYVIKGQPNTIYYQYRMYSENQNGGENNEVRGPLQQIVINTVSGQMPTVELKAEPTEQTAQSVYLKAEVDSKYAIQGVKYGVNGEYPQNGSIDLQGYLCDADGNRIAAEENGTYEIFICDALCGVASDTLEVTNIDKTAPALTSNSAQAANGSYSIDLTLTEENAAADPGKLMLHLSTVNPNGTASDAGGNTVAYTAIPWSEAPDMTEGSPNSAAGIYSIDAEYAFDETAGHTLNAVLEGMVSDTGELWAYTEDEAGNRSEPVRLFTGAENVPPKFESVQKDETGGMILNFTGGVMLAEPVGAAGDSEYSSQKRNVPIYKDGKYTIKYYDFFGNEYQEEIDVAVDGNFSDVNVAFSESVRTKNDVTVTVTATDEASYLKLTGCEVTDMSGTAMGANLYTVSLSEDGRSLEVLMKENGKINVQMSYGAEGESSATGSKTVIVDNIDRKAEAELVWSYAAGEPAGSETSTDASVTVYAVSTDDTEDLIGVDGALSHTFTSGAAGQTHTFKFRDSAGNEGTITATLPVDIINAAAEPLAFDIEAYITASGVMRIYDEYNYVDGAEAFAFGKRDYSSENRMNIRANKDDADILILEYGTSADDVTADTESAAIDGVTLSGGSITITKNAQFTVAVRAGDNVLVMPMNVENIVTTGEVGLIYAVLDRFTRRVYFDPKGQNLTVTNEEGVETENEYELYNGYYYHDFTENGDFIFYYQDMAGETGYIMASVRDLVSGSIEPANLAAPVRWWPYNGTDESELITNNVNYDVTAQVKYNMNVTGAKLCYDDGNGKPGALVTADVAELNLGIDTVDIVYNQNASDVLLVVTGENETEHTLCIDDVTVIDKTAPVVNHNYNSENPCTEAVITFTPDEDVLCSSIASETYYSLSNSMTVTIEENGAYSYTFTDKAGNSTKVDINVTNIDSDVPVVRFSLTGTDEGFDSWEALAAENAVRDVTRVYLKSNEAATCTFQERSIELTADTWTGVDIRHTGVYGMTVADKAGNVILTSLTGIRVPDTQPPTITLASLYISIPQNIDAAELDSALIQGVQVIDNESAAGGITVTIDKTALNTSKKGTYTITYTAADEANNSAQATRYVVVIGPNELSLTVNGIMTTQMGTLVLETGSLDFEVGNLTETNGISEPYQLYVKKGFRTIGQMKNNSNIVKESHMELYGNGFYTVYVVSLGRRQYLTYLYIEQ